MIPDINHILFATDLSENSRKAFDYAISIATRYSGGITLLHVLEQLPSRAKIELSAWLGQEGWNQIQNQYESHAKNVLIGKNKERVIIKEALAQYCENAKINSDECYFQTYDVIIREGDVVEEIVRIANEKICDLIVMGSHKGLITKAGLGSVTKGVLRESKKPVLVAPPPEQ
jgi:nucleotide-binding universal stress UspA family protein